MCWMSARFPKAYIAKEDITVYKVVKLKDYCYISACKEFEYYSNTLYNLTHKIILKVINNIYCIEEGFHSYKSLHYAKHMAHSIGMSIIECIIPRDTIFYENDTELVSESILIKNQLDISSMLETIPKLQVANEDIVTYTMVETYLDDLNIYDRLIKQTPSNNYITEVFSKPIDTMKYGIDPSYVVYGAFTSFMYLESVHNGFSRLHKYNIHKCIIPKGAKYYVIGDTIYSNKINIKNVLD